MCSQGFGELRARGLWNGTLSIKPPWKQSDLLPLVFAAAGQEPSAEPEPLNSPA